MCLLFFFFFSFHSLCFISNSHSIPLLINPWETILTCVMCILCSYVLLNVYCFGCPHFLFLEIWHILYVVCYISHMLYNTVYWNFFLFLPHFKDLSVSLSVASDCCTVFQRVYSLQVSIYSPICGCPFYLYFPTTIDNSIMNIPPRPLWCFLWDLHPGMWCLDLRAFIYFIKRVLDCVSEQTLMVSTSAGSSWRFLCLCRSTVA